MEFSHEYFDDEIREDFYVSGLMKRVWAANLEVMSDVAKVCEKHNIRWFADYGTLLGAVRHGGCIPWDDDLDVGMFGRLAHWPQACGHGLQTWAQSPVRAWSLPVQQ